MSYRMPTHSLWPVRRAAWAMLVVGGLPSLIGALAVGACLLAMASGRTDPFAVIVAGLAVIFLLIPGLTYVVLAVFVWRARAGAVLGAAIYTWVLLGLFALGALRDVIGSGRALGSDVRLAIEGAGIFAFVMLLWCLRAARRSIPQRNAQGFDVILPNSQPPQVGYPLTTPPPARGH